jgi:hypothetical protein
MKSKKKMFEEDDVLLHEDDSLMIPPPGYKFIPRFETVCGKPGCFECFDVYCERCESKDRRIVELEMRNNDLVKYITQLQGRIFGRKSLNDDVLDVNGMKKTCATDSSLFPADPSTGSKTNPFAYIQSPILYDPSLKVNYIATTTFAPAPHEFRDTSL